MGNVANKGKKGLPVQAFSGDITRTNLNENTASVLEHLVCVSGSVTFKAFHCHEQQDHQQGRCGIFIAGKIFANIVCRKLSGLLIFATNFTVCPPSSVNQLFIDGLRNIPKLECIEFIGCTFSTETIHSLITGLASRPHFTHLLFRGCYGLTIDESISTLLASPAHVALKSLGIISCDIDDVGVCMLGAAMAKNPTFRSCSFKFAPVDQMDQKSEEVLISVFTNILPLVESFHLLNWNTMPDKSVAVALVEVLSTTHFPRAFQLDLCPLPVSLEVYQEILQAISKSTITKLQLSLPKVGVESGLFDATLQSLIEVSNLGGLSLLINEPGNLHGIIPSHTYKTIALALAASSCKLRAISIPGLDEKGTRVVINSLAKNTSLQYVSVGQSEYPEMGRTLHSILTQHKNTHLCAFHPLPIVNEPHHVEALKRIFHRNFDFCLRRRSTLVQLCFLTIDRSSVLTKHARAILPKDLHNRMLYFIAWKTKREKHNGAMSLLNFWEFVATLDWCP